MDYRSDYILRLIEQMGSAIRLAFERFRGGGDADESLGMIHDAIGLAVDMDPSLFLTLAPQSMVSLVEISGFDDRLVGKMAEALMLEADILESRGLLVEAGVRREQSTALLHAIDPSWAN